MKKKQRLLVFLLIGLLLVGAVIGALLIFMKPEEETEKSIPVASASRDEITKVTIKNSTGRYTIVKDDSLDVGYYCEDIENLPQLKSLYVSVIDECADLSAAFKYENANLSRYGLDDPSAQFDVESRFGNYTIYLGDNAGSENYCYYMVSTEPGTVYAARRSRFYNCGKSVYNLVNRLLAPHAGGARPGNDESDNPDWFSFTTADGSFYKIETLNPGYNDGSGSFYRFYQSEPVKGYVTGARLQTVFSRLMQFCASNLVVNNPTEEQLAGCGLDNPLCTLNIAFGDEVAELSFAPIAGSENYYCYKQGVDAIWLVADYMISWLDVTPRTLLSDYVLAPVMSDVTAVSVTAYGESFSFKTDKEKDNNEFAKLYKLACSVNSQSFGSGSGEEVASITFTLTSGESRTVSLHRADSARMLTISLDGEPLGNTIREAYAETLLAACKSYEAGESVATDW